MLVPVRASPVPSVVRGSFVVKFFSRTKVGGTTGRPPDIEVEPWDEPDEGEKLRASALPPKPATRVALSRFRPHTLVPDKS